ncbi:hypothetical protein HHL22_10135 [Hymenobacter sp. RP-2-7]|uniref:CcmD family protein n=1 Tax=Hymenobacter polaris TaxID=2682546 RepID=A0A7Y0FM74_9BACT|nr:hypothetical protein [Hymenobacter polaris]NML65563.1 hypothetical protein [Hymenobacter polaris]
MKAVRVILFLLILCALVSRISVAAYEKDMSVLTTTYEIHNQNPQEAIEQENLAKRDAVRVNYAIGILTVLFFASFFFGRKQELDNNAK